MHTPFTFTPTGSDKADAFLHARAKYLAPMSADAQLVFLKSAITFARNLPLTATEDAFVKSSVLLTLQGWLDEVMEAA